MNVTYTYRNTDSGKDIVYAMNETAQSEVESLAYHINEELDNLRAGRGDPLAAIEGCTHYLLLISGSISQAASQA